MSVTVYDCLKLSALRQSKVVAGHKGLNRIVSAVSVLEYADASLLSDELFLGNELIISALISIKDSTEAQCKLIRRLHEGGEVGLILYYLGIFVPKLDEQLLKTADELDFPLICMPENRFDFRYSEAISEILGLIIKDQMKETYFVTGIIDRISQLQERHQTIGAVMRMLSDRLRCSLLLVNYNMEQRGFSSWPMASHFTHKEILDEHLANRQLNSQDSEIICLKKNNMNLYINHISITFENAPLMYLVAANEQNPLPIYYLKQASEVISIFINNWQYDFKIEDSHALIHAILEDDPLRMRKIAKKLKIDVASIHTMWIIMGLNKNDENRSSADKQHKQNRNAKYAITTKSFLSQYRKLVLVDILNDSIIALMSDSPFIDNPDDGFEKTLMELLRNVNNNVGNETFLIISNNLMTTNDVCNAYMLTKTCLDTCHKIYPHKHIFDLHELQFAKECITILESGEAKVSSYLKPLEHLLLQEDGQELIETLSVFFLDTQSNMQLTGELLFMHKNTVNYRINKIKQRLGHDIIKMPKSYKLYMATALHRLLK